MKVLTLMFLTVCLPITHHFIMITFITILMRLRSIPANGWTVPPQLSHVRSMATVTPADSKQSEEGSLEALNVLLCLTGSVATIKWVPLVQALTQQGAALKKRVGTTCQCEYEASRTRLRSKWWPLSEPYTSCIWTGIRQMLKSILMIRSGMLGRVVVAA